MTRSLTLIVAAGIALAATACSTDATRLSTLPTRPTSEGATVADSGAPTGESAGTGATADAPTTTPSSADVGRFVRASDDGATLSLRVGETAVLIQADPFSPDPVVDGEAIELVETVSVAGTGDRRWEIRALRAGSATIEARDGDVGFVITVDVAG